MYFKQISWHPVQVIFDILVYILEPITRFWEEVPHQSFPKHPHHPWIAVYGAFRIITAKAVYGRHSKSSRFNGAFRSQNCRHLRLQGWNEPFHFNALFRFKHQKQICGSLQNCWDVTRKPTSFESFEEVPRPTSTCSETLTIIIY